MQVSVSAKEQEEKSLLRSVKSIRMLSEEKDAVKISDTFFVPPVGLNTM